jgi:hypothetical protein
MESKMPTAIDWSNPKTFKLSSEALETYQKDEECIHNSAARSNPNEPFLDALLRHTEEYEKTEIDGKKVFDFISSL